MRVYFRRGHQNPTPTARNQASFIDQLMRIDSTTDSTHRLDTTPVTDDVLRTAKCNCLTRLKIDRVRSNCSRCGTPNTHRFRTEALQDRSGRSGRSGRSDLLVVRIFWSFGSSTGHNLHIYTHSSLRSLFAVHCSPFTIH